MRSLIIVCMLGIVSGCTSYSTTLANEKGHTTDCHASGFGLISSMVAKSSYDECVKNAHARGFDEE
ncbi:hypothetical protein K6Q96_06540 [Grimontia kaedaensis]|uniref:Lipoprotein n=1 Tax=Grimontia kaedaensis TaxID=2872157 RepID=A0ABY4WXC1_9GAMM|nr:hypothetical protein [Grimontia kaedaensis]USH03648.1 hypothetical protein K6Q96_06540 [Grimontia kaedaensis]